MNDESCYAQTAYGASEVPQQQHSAERPWIIRIAKTRLPWGNTTKTFPGSFLDISPPKKLRFWETFNKEREEQLTKETYTPEFFEKNELHAIQNHEKLRHALLSKTSQLWIHLYSIGRFLFWFFLLILSATSLLILITIDEDQHETARYLIKFSSIALGIPLISWGVGKLVIHKFPSLWLKPSRGPIWELNRRTGLVTVFDYKNNGEYKKNGTIGELTAPFYEFDAYIATSPDSQGMPMNVLYLAHRYRNIMINFGALLCPGPETQPACALWDFIQNYMDVSRPLPDLPQYEEYRHLDPTTAAYDRRVGRNPRFWIDMDDATFKQVVKEMHQRVASIDTFRRPNLMARYVTYVD